jgi:hypothetical protein
VRPPVSAGTHPALKALYSVPVLPGRADTEAGVPPRTRSVLFRRAQLGRRLGSRLGLIRWPTPAYANPRQDSDLRYSVALWITPDFAPPCLPHAYPGGADQEGRQA